MPIVASHLQCTNAWFRVHWIGDKIEIIPGDSFYVIASAEADTYERTRCILGEIWEKDFLKVTDYEIPPIQAVGSDEEF